MSEHQIQVSQTFEEKLKSRIKESIGELVTDEDLSKLVHKSIHEVFFGLRSNPKYKAHVYGSTESQYLPPLLNEIVYDLLKDTMSKAVDEYMKNNSEHIDKVIAQVIEQGAGDLMLKAISRAFESTLMTLQTNLTTQILNR